MNIYQEIIEKIKTGEVKTSSDLEKAKKIVSKKHKVSIPTNSLLLKLYHKNKESDEKVISVLRTRPVRSLSGVVNVSVLTKPFPCPGKCIYCPEEKGMPKSYLKNEPAAMRAFNNNFHPAKQIKTRLRALRETGHITEKLEVRIVGGTWSFYPDKYKQWFIKSCFDACNGEKSSSLKEAQKRNEKAEHRIVCLSVETRPDYINKKELKKLRVLGVTMVELGVQSLFDDVLVFIKRGHKVKEIIEATKLLKDTGFKVCYQVMLNLPKSSPEKDVETFRKMFQEPDFRPDFLKIYPCLVMEGTGLYQLWKKKEHKTFSAEQLIEIISEIKKDIIPSYVRIQRLFRDIPAESIGGGCKISNLRESVAKKADKEGWRCQCIRCREVKEKYDHKKEVFLYKERYKASDGEEVFLSLESKNRDTIYALLRLRNPSNDNVFSVLKDATIIREIKTYGGSLSVTNKEENISSPQHKGMGKRLIKEAEKITEKDFKKKKIAVIAGVGTREYWRKRGYRLRESYMVKRLNARINADL
jgi:elongator complex protein 3